MEYRTMTIDEYAEKILGIHLCQFQKEFLRKLEKLPPNSQLISTPRGTMVVKDGETKEELQ